MTLNNRSLNLLRNDGYTAQVVERYNVYAKRKVDLFGVIDIVAISPHQNGVLGVQVTSKGNIYHRAKKVRQNRNMAVWLAAGNMFEIHGWYKEKNRWKVKRIPITEVDDEV